MKIYDCENKRILKSISLYLTPEEAADLGFSANDLSENPQKQHHHIDDKDYKNKIILSVYTKKNINQFDEESKKIISAELE